MRRGLLATLVALTTQGTLFAVACSGPSGTGLFGGNGDGGVGDAPLVTPDAAEVRVDGPSDNGIDPLEIGRLWVFQVTPLDGGVTPGGCSPGTATSSVIGPGATIDGSATVRYQPLCDTFLVDALVEGDRVIAYPVDAGFAPGILVDAPVQEGHTWSFSGNGPDFVWHDAGTVTVPAGTYTDCWTRAYTTQSQARFIYCRAVGLVQVDDTDFGYRAVLTSKNF
jgi:hypothetical protein